MSLDAGLRKFMLGVYNKLTLGILLAGALAWAAGAIVPVTQLVFGTPLYFVVQWGPIVLMLGSMFFMKNPSPLATGIMYWAIVVMMGLGLGIWVAAAEAASSGMPMDMSTRGGIAISSVTYPTIAKAFLITASAFGALSLFGYTTKRDLSGLGSFAIMAMWGVLAMFASILLLFLLPWLDTSPVRSNNYRPLSRILFWVFVAVALGLGVCGGKPAHEPWVRLSQVLTAYYFAHFLIILPIVSKLEKTTPLPNSISEAVLAKYGKSGGGAPVAQPAE